MPAVGDLQCAFVADFGATIVMQARDLGEGREHVKLGEGGGGLLNGGELADWGTPGAHEQAMFMVSSMIGTMVVARAVDDPRLSKLFCEAALQHFSEVGK